jgi:hypothetical protein
MNRSQHKRTALVFIILLAALIAVPVVLTWQQVRQANLNKQLVLAVTSLNVDQTRKCLRAGAAPNLLDTLPASESPFQILVRLLHHSPGNLNSMKGRPLLDSILRRKDARKNKQKCTEIALLLLKAGADANCPYDPLHNPDDRAYYCPPLFSAAFLRLPQVIQALLEHGANANPEGCSPLREVAGCEDPSMGLMLLAHGANPDYQDRAGFTPLIIAVGVDDKVLVRALLAKGANLALKDWSGETALHEARRLKRWDMVTLLSQNAMNREKQKSSNTAKH